MITLVGVRCVDEAVVVVEIACVAYDVDDLEKSKVVSSGAATLGISSTGHWNVTVAAASVNRQHIVGCVQIAPGNKYCNPC